METLIITQGLDPKSGWGRYSLGIVSELQKRKAAIRILTEEIPRADARHGTFLPLGGPFDFLINLHRIRRFARGVGVVHAFDGWPYGVYGYFAVLGTKKKLFINGVGTYAVAPLGDFGKGWLMKLAYRRANKIFCISRYVKGEIEKRISLPNLEVVHLASDPLPSLSEEEIESKKEKYQIRNASPVLLTVGAIKHRKGQLDTVRAVALLKDRYPDILYLLIGSEEVYYANHIREYAKEKGLERNVRILSDIKSDEDLAFFYSISDVFLLNSRNDGRHFEGFGLVFLEAANQGRPVIGSRGCGIEDALEDGYNGYLAEQGNAEDVRDKVMKALAQSESLGLNSREFASRFSWVKTVDSYIRYYQK
ncbi:MAG TPA: glycosyltransferase family 4 protein [Candidatus Paceibacterota bacterium]|nr:glycosyltransferase family 4 protein [Candidatus Paceibacterota bacterium]